MAKRESHSSFDKLVPRYLSGELSPGELRHFQEMLQQDPEKKSLVEAYRRIWESAGSGRGPDVYDLDAEWALLQEQIQVRDNGAPTVRSLQYYLFRVAAVLVAGLFIASGWYYIARLSGVERIVAENNPVEVVLADGTEVTLNKGSKISYKRKFSISARKVSLWGEAWFDVARDTTRPFTIDAGTALVEVLGTSFNVNAYRENPTVEITVKSGVVALIAKEDHQEQLVLRAGNSGTYHKEEGELRLTPASDPNKISWKTRELFFDNASLREVVDLVGQVYGVNLVIMDQAIASCPITVAFIDQSLESILRVLAETLDLAIERNDKEYRLSGKGCEE